MVAKSTKLSKQTKNRRINLLAALNLAKRIVRESAVAKLIPRDPPRRLQRGEFDLAPCLQYGGAWGNFGQTENCLVCRGFKGRSLGLGQFVHQLGTDLFHLPAEFNLDFLPLQLLNVR